MGTKAQCIDYQGLCVKGTTTAAGGAACELIGCFYPTKYRRFDPHPNDATSIATKQTD